MTLANPVCRRRAGLAALCAAAALALAAPQAQEHNDPRRKTYDEILDTDVRDGWVYYRALKADRARLDAYINSLATADLQSLPRDGQVAFWLNAYNALVLQTVVEHYPITARTREYPPRSIRQIPGAFERMQHRVG